VKHDLVLEICGVGTHGVVHEARLFRSNVKCAKGTRRIVLGVCADVRAREDVP
jgi:hypothetical protein